MWFAFWNFSDFPPLRHFRFPLFVRCHLHIDLSSFFPSTIRSIIVFPWSKVKSKCPLGRPSPLEFIFSLESRPVFRSASLRLLSFKPFTAPKSWSICIECPISSVISTNSIDSWFRKSWCWHSRCLPVGRDRAMNTPRTGTRWMPTINWPDWWIISRRRLRRRRRWYRWCRKMDSRGGGWQSVCFLS